MIGTSIEIYFAGNDAAAGVLSLQKTILADADGIHDNALIGATSIVLMISSEVGPVNKGYAFDAVTGTITNYPVLTGETHTILYKKP